MEFNNKSIGHEMLRIEKELLINDNDNDNYIYKIESRLDQLDLYFPGHPDIRVLKMMLKR